MLEEEEDTDVNRTKIIKWTAQKLHKHHSSTQQSELLYLLTPLCKVIMLAMLQRREKKRRRQGHRRQATRKRRFRAKGTTWLSLSRYHKSITRLTFFIPTAENIRSKKARGWFNKPVKLRLCENHFEICKIHNKPSCWGKNKWANTTTLTKFWNHFHDLHRSKKYARK